MEAKAQQSSDSTALLTEHGHALTHGQGHTPTHGHGQGQGQGHAGAHGQGATAPIAIPKAGIGRWAPHPQQQPGRSTAQGSTASPMATMPMVQNSFVSPPISPVDDCELEYNFVLWRADQLVGNAPLGSPPRRPPAGPATPCGCNDYSTIENECGELVCMSCGVVCGRIHVHQ